MNTQTKLSAKGQVVIPKEVRDALGWPEGMKLEVTRTGDRVILGPVAPPRERISYEEFRRRVPKYEGPRVAVEDMTSRIGKLFKNWKE
jgi:AbrB family looped-hinge helix DNA binding protein